MVLKVKKNRPKTASKIKSGGKMLTRNLFLLLVTIVAILTILVASLCIFTTYKFQTQGPKTTFTLSIKQITNSTVYKSTTKFRDNILSQVSLIERNLNETRQDYSTFKLNGLMRKANSSWKPATDNVNSARSLHTSWSRVSSQRSVNQTYIPVQESLLNTIPNDGVLAFRATAHDPPLVSVMSENESKLVENEKEARITKHTYNNASSCQILHNNVGSTEAKSTCTIAEINIYRSDNAVVESSSKANETVNSNSADESKFKSFAAVNTEQNANEIKDIIDTSELKGQSDQYNRTQSASPTDQSFNVSVHCADGQMDCDSVAPPSISSRCDNLIPQACNDVSKVCDNSIHESTHLQGENKSLLSERCSNNVAHNHSIPSQLSVAVSLNLEEDENLYGPVQQGEDCYLHMGEHESFQRHMQQQNESIQASLFANGPLLPSMQQNAQPHPSVRALEPYNMSRALHDETIPGALHRNESSYMHEEESILSRHGDDLLSHLEQQEYLLPRTERSISPAPLVVEPVEHLIEACQPQSGHHYDGLDGQRFPDEPQAAENEELLGAVGGYVGNLDEAYNEIPPPANDPLNSLPDELLPRSYDSDSGAGSIIDPAFQNRSGFHELHYDNNYIYEQLQNIPWILGYHSQGQSISIYCDLDNVEADDRHRDLCAATRQPWSKYRIKPHHD